MGRGPGWTEEEDKILKECWENGSTRAEKLALVEEKIPTHSAIGALQRMSILFGKAPIVKRKCARQLKIKRGKYSVKELEMLYECWRDGITKAKTVELIKEKLPRRTSASAYQQIYLLSKDDPKWKKLASRRQNTKDQQKQELEEKREEKRQLRELKKKELKIRSLSLTKKGFITENLKSDHAEQIQEMMTLDFFFCQKQKSFTTNVACIFRKFSKEDKYGFKFSGICDKCKKLDEFTDSIYKMLKGEK